MSGRKPFIACNQSSRAEIQRASIGLRDAVQHPEVHLICSWRGAWKQLGLIFQ
jgi:hypothetical protein